MFYKPSADRRQHQKDRFNSMVRYGVDTSNPKARYDIHPNDLGAKLFDVLLSEGELREEIISVFKRIDLRVNSKVEEWIRRKKFFAKRKQSIKQTIEPLIRDCEDAATTRMYVMIKILMIHLLENQEQYSFIGDLSDYSEDDSILFWHELHGIKFKYADYGEFGRISWPEAKNPHKGHWIKFNRFARINFERLEDWFIDISEVENMTFKCPQEKIWENNSNPEKRANSENLRLKTCTHQPPWGIHPKYGPIPFSRYLDVESYINLSGGLDRGLPNIDDYYEGLNRL